MNFSLNFLEIGIPILLINEWNDLKNLGSDYLYENYTNLSGKETTDKYVSFNHLPAEATIDIYSLGGVYVRSIDKSDATSQFAQWDLKNQYGYPVASGMYVARVKSGGEEKILKIALVQETQVLKYY